MFCFVFVLLFWHLVGFFSIPLFLFYVLYFLEFIKCVYGLRWIYCGGGVACYVECTNVVQKWEGSDCDNRNYQGRRGWFFKLDVETPACVLQKK